ncbi:rRNA methyltransferase [Haemophilus paracuniculus]|uniref:rRNA methyltransferase n=1 Tax=Haemophilus paracuniculus TaxID=734 RepID=A0A1T0ASU9_9PAST|nr:TrmH family RNA methyltransferase [Haemophilus paracuniculus]OOR99445.1 rRNA methyltransferase [Haemophilus paracuniculus]
MKPTFNQKPRFQTLEQRQQRENRSENRAESRNKRSDFSKNPRPTLHSEPIYPTTARKAGREGSVQIMVKGQKTEGKKTGALSSRAPEKIKKNRLEEMKVYGENACFTLFQQRPEAIVRLWATVEMAKKSGDLLSYLAEQKKAYHVVDNEEMERVTGTEHHGGICLLVKKAPTLSLEGYLKLPRQRDCVVVLDGVQNAQNIGGVVRACAFYGVKGIVVENGDALNSSSAARVAEGGLEFVHSLETKHKQIALAQLRNAGYQIVHLTRHKQANSLAKTPLAEKVAVVLSEIISADVEYPEDTTVNLSFENPLNSGLNVAVSAGVVLSQWYLNHKI